LPKEAPASYVDFFCSCKYDIHTIHAARKGFASMDVSMASFDGARCRVLIYDEYIRHRVSHYYLHLFTNVPNGITLTVIAAKLGGWKSAAHYQLNQSFI